MLMLVYEYQHIEVYLIMDIKRIGQWKYLQLIKFKILNQLHIDYKIKTMKKLKDVYIVKNCKK